VVGVGVEEHGAEGRGMVDSDSGGLRSVSSAWVRSPI